MDTRYGPGRKYSAAERRAAVDKAIELGVAKASKELGIPRGTLSCWKHLAGLANSGAAKAPPGLQQDVGSGARARDTQRGVQVEKAPGDIRGGGPEVPGGAAPAQPLGEATKGARTHVARVYTPSQRAAALELTDKVGPCEAARQLGISRYSIREWRRRVRLMALGEAETSPLVGPDENPAARRDARILEVQRAHPGLGPSQVRNQLRRDGLKVSTNTVRRVMEEHGYTPPKVKRTEVHNRTYEAVRPNCLWHLDFLHRYVHKQKIYVLFLLDDFSRFIVGASIWDGERVDAVIETFEAAVARYGRPEMVMSDGGSAFWAWRGVAQFTRLLEDYGIDQLIAKNPQTNGKLEVLNGNVQKELFNVERFFDLDETRRRLEAWVEFYNFKRTHHALGGLLVPADRQFGRADHVLAAIEAGRPADSVAVPLSVGARVLDLVRVTSHAGQLEVHLMGQRLWPEK